jgi:hypothetical protein
LFAAFLAVPWEARGLSDLSAGAEGKAPDLVGVIACEHLHTTSCDGARQARIKKRALPVQIL